jgi:hypothetical protein
MGVLSRRLPLSRHLLIANAVFGLFLKFKLDNLVLWVRALL